MYLFTTSYFVIKCVPKINYPEHFRKNRAEDTINHFLFRLFKYQSMLRSKSGLSYLVKWRYVFISKQEFSFSFSVCIYVYAFLYVCVLRNYIIYLSSIYIFYRNIQMHMYNIYTYVYIQTNMCVCIYMLRECVCVYYMYVWKKDTCVYN